MLALWQVPRAAADDDYDSTSHNWNGLSTFVSLARGDGLDVHVTRELDWATVTSNDVVAIIAPSRIVDPSRLERFIASGGAVLLADDFGGSSEALARLGLVRAPRSPAPNDRLWQGRTYAPLVSVRAPLAVGGDVVANHAAMFVRSDLGTPVLVFDDGAALAVAGNLGDGFYIAIADSSILINRMMEFAGNLDVAVAALRWLRAGRAQRLLLVIGDAMIVGEPKYLLDAGSAATPTKRAVASVNQLLQSASDFQITPLALRLVLLLITLLALMGFLLWLPPFRGRLFVKHWDGPPAPQPDFHDATAALLGLYQSKLEAVADGAALADEKKRAAHAPSIASVRQGLERALTARRVSAREFQKLVTNAQSVWRRLRL